MPTSSRRICHARATRCRATRTPPGSRFRPRLSASLPRRYSETSARSGVSRRELHGGLTGMVHPYRPSGSAADLAATAATIARDIALPHAAEVDAQARYPIETLKALADGGFHGLCLQKDLGGRGEGMRAFASVVEELAGGCASSAMIYVMHVSAAQAIVSSKTFAARGAVLKEIAAGRHLTTLAFSESGSRSQFWAPVSRMEEKEGHLVTSATKSW